MPEILPCPFCGNNFEEDHCDRLLSFHCRTCKYTRTFPGLLQSNESPVKVSWNSSTPEYYHNNAREEAIELLNKRVAGTEKASTELARMEKQNQDFEQTIAKLQNRIKELNKLIDTGLSGAAGEGKAEPGDGSIYVGSKGRRLGRMIMFHMASRDLEALHKMAEAIGIGRKHFQDKKKPHYDICKEKKALAISKGVIEVTDRELLRLCFDYL